MLAVTLAGMSVVAACSSTSGPSQAPPQEKSGTQLTVLAAASLTESYTELESTFEAGHDNVDVSISFGSSATLARQAAEGAPADVLATADARTMGEAQEAGVLAADPTVFATNSMVLALPADNPAGIRRFSDIDAGDVDYVACVESAPCGAVAKKLLDANHIAAEPASLEVDVKAVLTKVSLGEADAGLVYATDVNSAEDAGNKVTSVRIPRAGGQANSYLVAPLQQATSPDLARDWIRLVRSAQGQDILAGYGFAPPPGSGSG